MLKVIKNFEKGTKTLEQILFKINKDYYLLQAKIFLIALKADYF